MAIVMIKPLDEKKWHGKKGQENFTQPKTVEALYSTETGKLGTGLTAEEVIAYGEELGEDLNPRFKMSESHEFYGSKAGWVSLQNHPMTFNTDVARDYVKLALCKASKFVANSIEEYNKGMWPEATHYIFDESAEVEVKALKIDQRRKCITIDDRMDDEGRIALIQCITGKSFRGRSKKFITVEIDDIIETKPAEYLKYANMGKVVVNVLASIKECILRNILTKEGGSIFYMGEMIGIDEQGAVEWFTKGENQNMRLSIFNKLSTK